MNADLDRSLNGSDADLRAFVASLRAAPQARVREGFAVAVMSAGARIPLAVRPPMMALAMLPHPITPSFILYLLNRPAGAGCRPTGRS